MTDQIPLIIRSPVPLLIVNLSLMLNAIALNIINDETAVTGAIVVLLQY